MSWQKPSEKADKDNADKDFFPWTPTTIITDLFTLC